jgi:hypothetical protein
MVAVIAAAEKVGMGVFAWKMEFARDLQRLGGDRPHGMEEYRQVFGEGFVRELPGRYGLHLAGRALETFREVLAGKPSEEIVVAAGRPCGEMGQTGHFHIDLYGNYVFTSCVGVAMACSDLGRPVEREKYPHLYLLGSEGLAGLYRVATEQGFSPRRRYVNRCDLCEDVRRYLVREKKVRSADLQPVGFYEEMGK